jgi:serine/threonine-protein kinase RsbW
MNSSQSKYQLSWKYPAVLKNVELVCSDVAQVLEKHSLNKKDLFAIELLLREALNNAVLHGCDESPLLSFSCRLMFSERELTIEVCDDGLGFDWRRKLESIPAHSDESGRGLSIYALYASSIKFNESGNCITLTKIINQGEKDD